ncbi:MAG: hypothetical protein NTZ16_13585, partial [Verrucomicrobia bacterium]|nr:hypothetical protein [Verrucomicrobiota bacterium]
MKKLIIATGLALAVTTQATVVNWYSSTLGSTLADNSAAGATFNTSGGTWSGAWGGGAINGVDVVLNISGGYNGDLYGYLVYNDGVTTQTAILLNRVTGAAAPVMGLGGG